MIRDASFIVSSFEVAFADHDPYSNHSSPKMDDGQPQACGPEAILNAISTSMVYYLKGYYSIYYLLSPEEGSSGNVPVLFLL